MAPILKNAYGLVATLTGTFEGASSSHEAHPERAV